MSTIAPRDRRHLAGIATPPFRRPAGPSPWARMVSKPGIRNPILACAAVIACAGGSGCTGSASPTSRPIPQTLRLAARTDVQSLDPAISYDLVSWPLVRLLYQGLLDYDSGTNLIPWLAAELPTMSSDGRTLTFRLRPGVRFANGRQVDASDFVYTLERLLNPATKSPGQGFFQNILGAPEYVAAREKDAGAPDDAGKHAPSEPRHVVGLEAVDRATLRIRLKNPDLAFRQVLAMPFAYVVAREGVEAAGEDFGRRPLGTGPFLLTEWVRSTRLRFTRNPRYWEQAPPLREVRMQIGPDALLQAMMFERGELDYLAEIATPDFGRVMRTPELRRCVVTNPSNAVRYVALNVEMAPFQDARVRQALNYAVDRDRLLSVVNGRGVVARGVLPPNMPGYNPRLRGYRLDRARARSLLSASGFPSGFSVPLWINVDDQQAQRLAEALQQELAEVGVRVELKPVAFSIFNDAVAKRRTVPMAISAWFQDYPDPADFLDVLLNGDRLTDEHGNNAAFYSNPNVNKMFREAASETNAARRFQLYQEAEQQVVADAPWIFLLHPTLHLLCQPWIRGVAPHPVWPARFERWSVDVPRPHVRAAPAGSPPQNSLSAVSSRRAPP